MRAVRTRTHKYQLNLAHQLPYPHASDLWEFASGQGVLMRQDKMMGQRPVEQFLNRPREELYDLGADPNELKNLASDPQHANVLTDLRKRCQEWREGTNDPWLVKNKHE